MPKPGSRLGSVPGPAPWHSFVHPWQVASLIFVLQVGKGSDAHDSLAWDQGIGKGCYAAHRESFPFSGDACSQSLHYCVFF